MVRDVRVLVIGSDGFIGRNVISAFPAGYEVHGTITESSGNRLLHNIDLIDRQSIARVLKSVKPEIIINCAGVVSNDETAKKNVLFTQNILTAVLDSGLPTQRIIISGSAAEYGVVDNSDIPVSENTPLRATSLYGESKIQETTMAVNFRREFGLPVTVARIFNPVGLGMHPRLLLPKIILDIRAIESGISQVITINRLDSKRDYISVGDVSTAFVALATGNPRKTVYNIGSGKSTSNRRLIELVVQNSSLKEMPQITQICAEAEPIFASCADLSNIKADLGWRPSLTLEESIKEIMNA